MSKKSLNEILNNDIEKNYKTEITSSKILNSTDYFEQVEQKANSGFNLKLYKTSFATICVILFAFVLAFSVLLISNIKLRRANSFITELDRLNQSFPDKPHITSEQIAFMNANSDRAGYNPSYMIAINSNMKMYIYEGEKTIDSSKLEKVYFYIVIYDNQPFEFYINIDGKQLTVNSNSNYGILKKAKTTSKKLVLFTIVDDNTESTYYFETNE